MDATPPRLRPRFSLLNLLLLTALVATSLTTAMLWREVGPLRSEVLKLRNETGQITVFDPTKIYVTSIETLEEDTWKWRVYLPKGGDYELRTIVGIVSGRNPLMSKLEWFEKCGFNCSSPDVGAGDVTISAKLRAVADDAGTWVVDTKWRDEATPNVSRGGTCGRGGMDWLDGEPRAVSGDALPDGQRELDQADGIELLTLLRCEVTKTASGWTSKTPDPIRDNDGVAVWIVPRKP